MGQFFEELKRRNVLRVAAGYVVASWLIIQVVETIFPAFGFGDAAVRIVTIVLAIGLIPALILAWAFEITPEGLKKEKDVDRSKIDPQRMKTLDRLIIVVLTLGVGYFAFDKFILDPVRDVEMIEEAKEVARSEVLVRSYGSRSIAVLPFVNLSADPEQEYFSEGISEELLNLLAKIPELRVISRSSAFSFKTQNVDIPTFANQVNVAYVLEGSVRKSGNNIRITAQLIDALTDTHLWSKTYDRTLDDIFAVQDEIANKVVSQMKVELLGPLPKVKKVDPQAYAMFLRATYLINQVDPALFAKAEGLLQNALAIDPDYTDALGALGRIYSLRDGPNEDGFALVQDIIDRILAIDPNDGNAIGWLVWMAMFRDNNLASCAAYLERALVLAPTDVQILRYSVRALLNVHSSTLL